MWPVVLAILCLYMLNSHQRHLGTSFVELFEYSSYDFYVTYSHFYYYVSVLFMWFLFSLGWVGPCKTVMSNVKKKHCVNNLKYSSLCIKQILYLWSDGKISQYIYQRSVNKNRFTLPCINVCSLVHFLNLFYVVRGSLIFSMDNEQEIFSAKGRQVSKQKRITQSTLIHQ